MPVSIKLSLSVDAPAVRERPAVIEQGKRRGIASILNATRRARCGGILFSLSPGKTGSGDKSGHAGQIFLWEFWV
jgi:hypothetical protein